MEYAKRSSYLVTGRSGANSWYKIMQLLDMQTEIPAGDNFGGRDNMTKDMNVTVELDEGAVDEILSGVVHPAFEMREQSRMAYEVEFTYFFVFNNWHMDEKMKFVYNYMDRLINYPTPNSDFIYQGDKVDIHIPEVYNTVDPLMNNRITGGFDQIRWLHDTIREDGISRRHQIITWIPTLDCFSISPPCLQRVWIRVLVPKSEWHKYPGCIPIEVHIDYRSWDIGRAILSNLYGLLSMVNRYICGNITMDNEFIVADTGEPIPINELKMKEGMGVAGITNNKDHAAIINRDTKPDFKIMRAVLFGDAAHIYNSAYPLAKNIKPANSPYYTYNR